jgi:hypothetical protein
VQAWMGVLSVPPARATSLACRSWSRVPRRFGHDAVHGSIKVRPQPRPRDIAGGDISAERLLRPAAYSSFGESSMSVGPRVQEGHSRSDEVIYIADHHAGSCRIAVAAINRSGCGKV